MTRFEIACVLCTCAVLAGGVKALADAPLPTAPSNLTCFGPAVRVAQWDVCFSPGGHCADKVVEQINQAKISVRAQAYGFNSVAIARALVDAHRRGVDVRVILDRSNTGSSYSQAGTVAAADIPVSIDSAHPIAHAKIFIIDGEVVVNGSYNFTSQAEKNSEDLTVLHSPVLAKTFTENWILHMTHSKAYQPKEKTK